MGRKPNTECDGTAADYHRHRRRGEKPCPMSKRRWARRQREVRERLRQGEYRDR